MIQVDIGEAENRVKMVRASGKCACARARLVAPLATQRLSTHRSPKVFGLRLRVGRGGHHCFPAAGEQHGL